MNCLLHLVEMLGLPHHRTTMESVQGKDTESKSDILILIIKFQRCGENQRQLLKEGKIHMLRVSKDDQVHTYVGTADEVTKMAVQFKDVQPVKAKESDLEEILNNEQ